MSKKNQFDQENDPQLMYEGSDIYIDQDKTLGSNFFYETKDLEPQQECEETESEAEASSDEEEQNQIPKKLKIFKKPDKKIVHTLKAYVDTEFNGNTSLMLQVKIKGKIRKQDVDFSFVVLDEKYKYLYKQKTIDSFLKLKNCHVIFLLNFAKNQTQLIIIEVLIKILNNLYGWDFQNLPQDEIFFVDLYFFYSSKDLSIAFGINNMLPYYTKQKRSISQTRNINGFLQFMYQSTLFKIKLKDLKGIDIGGLEAIANGCGINTSRKNLLKKFKTNMEAVLTHSSFSPIVFILYGLNDVNLLCEIIDSKINSYNNILKDYGVTKSKHLFNYKNFPLTLGSIVNKVWQTFLNVVILKDDLLIKLSLKKMGILNSLHKNYSQNLETFSLIKQIKSQNDLKTLDSKIKTKLKYFSTAKSIFTYDITSFASRKWFLDHSENTTLGTLALNSGGRTNNEDPHNYKMGPGIDIDIQGAYTSQLALTSFPIGKPRTYAKSSNDTVSITLKEFLDKHENDLKSGLYKIVVSGKLTFSQDLIYSKIIDINAIYRRSEKMIRGNSSTYEVNANLVLLRKEIVYGTITPAVLELMQKVSATKELKEFYNLTVDSAVYWSEKDRVNSIEELSECFLKETNEYTLRDKNSQLKDLRTHAWYKLPLKNFIEPLAKKRKNLQDDLKSKKLTSLLEIIIAKSQQLCIKNILNAMWGIMTSIHFDMNNIVLSDIITAGIRCNVWQMAKCFLLKQTITDGGAMELNNTLKLKNKSKRPGFNSLSSLQNIKKHPSLKIVSLGDDTIDWDNLFKNNTPPKNIPECSSLLTKSFDDFWASYNLKRNFEIEVKTDNLFIKGAYMSKAHYAFIIWNEKTKSYSNRLYKLRGFRQSDLTNNLIKAANPIYYLMESILNDVDNFKFQYQFFQEKLITISSWRKSLIKTKEGLVSKYGDKIYPGDSVISDFRFSLNNTHFHIDTLKQYKRRSRRTLRKKDGVKMQLFEKFLEPCGIEKTVAIMANDDDLRKKVKVID